MWADGLRSWFRRATGAGDPGHALALSPQDVRELTELAVRVASEYPGWAPEVLVGSLRRLLCRRVPLRAVRSHAGAPGIGDLCFADGTVVIVRGWHHGDLGRVAVALVGGRVRLDSFEVEQGRVVLEVDAAERRLRLVALGVVQAR